MLGQVAKAIEDGISLAVVGAQQSVDGFLELKAIGRLDVEIHGLPLGVDCIAQRAKGAANGGKVRPLNNWRFFRMCVVHFSASSTSATIRKSSLELNGLFIME